MIGDDEEELELLWEEVYGVPRTTREGTEDIRTTRRSKRIFTSFIRLQPRVKAVVHAILKRDRVPSLNVLIEDMVEAYQEKHGYIDKKDIPSEAEMLRRYLNLRGKSDAKQSFK